MCYTLAILALTLWCHTLCMGTNCNLQVIYGTIHYDVLILSTSCWEKVSPAALL